MHTSAVPTASRPCSGLMALVFTEEAEVVYGEKSNEREKKKRGNRWDYRNLFKNSGNTIAHTTATL